jgi:SRSO17 transposase
VLAAGAPAAVGGGAGVLRLLRPAPTSLAELVRIAGIRWAVEECFQAAKDQVGLDHYQVRRYAAWYRHVTLVLVAQAFLAAVRAQAAAGQAGGS